MAKLIVKDRRLCIVNGRLVSDGDGAPCLCDDVPPTYPCDQPFPNVCWEIIWNEGTPCPWVSIIIPGVGSYQYLIEAAFFPRPMFIPDQFPRSIPDAITFQLRHDPTTLFPNDPEPPTSLSITADIEISTVQLGCDANNQWGIVQFILRAVRGDQPTDVPYLSGGVLLSDAQGSPVTPFGVTMPNARQTCGTGGYAGGSLIVRPVLSCGNNGQIYFAQACDNPDDLISVDFATRIPGARTCRYEGRIYAPVPAQSFDQPVPVEWLTQLCPQASGDFAIATKCRPAFPEGPDTVVYEIDQTIGAGNGAVRLVVSYPNPACPSRLCTAIVQYQPTGEIVDGPATPGTAHLNGTACALPEQVTCQPCPGDEPTPRPESPSSGDAMLDAMGFDPEEELRRVRAGGCCGPTV